MKNYKISVIVPIYNVEKYLNRCMESLLSQTYNNIELILVDDGSTDNSSKLCDMYAKKSDRVVVIHKKNGGLGSARNAGVLASTGDYVTFIDSDDWVTVDAYGYMLNVLIEHNCDVVQCSFIQTEEVCCPINDKEHIDIYTNKDILNYYMYYSTKTGSYSVWKFLYKAELVKDIKFREGKINEDIDYNYKVLRRANRLAVSNQVKYFYYQNHESLSTGGLKKRDYDLYEAASELLKLTSEETFKDIKFLGEVKFARTPFSLLSKIAYYGISDSSINKHIIVSKLTDELRMNYKILLRAPIDIMRKLLVIMFCVNFEISELVIRVYKTIRR